MRFWFSGRAPEHIFVREGETGIEAGVVRNPALNLYCWLGSTNGNAQALVRAAQVGVNAAGTPEMAVRALAAAAIRLGWTLKAIPGSPEFHIGRAPVSAVTAAATTGGILAGGAIGVVAACLVATMIAANFPTASKQPHAPAAESAPAPPPAVRQIAQTPAVATHVEPAAPTPAAVETAKAAPPAAAAAPPAVEVANTDPTPSPSSPAPAAVPSAEPVRRNLQRLTVCDDAQNVQRAVTTHRARGCRSVGPGHVEIVRDPAPGSHSLRIVEVRVIEDGREPVIGYAPRNTP